MVGRREFLVQSAAAVALAGTAKAGDPWDGMTWLNPPATWSRDGEVWKIKSRPKTDFWRHTSIDYVADNGHFLHRTVNGKFVFEARINGAYASEFDQAGLMVRANSETWMKCGSEFAGGKRNASVVFTREFSDWSTFPDLSQTAPVWWRIERRPNALDVFASLDGKSFQLVRSGYYAPSASVELGLMCCAPSGNGFDAVFDRLKLG